MAFSTFVAGQVLTAAQVNDYLMKQAVIVCTSSGRPTGVDGMVIYETDTKLLWIHNGLIFTPLISPPHGAPRSYASTLGGTGWAIGNGSITFRYVRTGRALHFTLVCTFGGSSTFGAGTPTFTIPVTVAYDQVWPARLNDVSGTAVYAFATAAAGTSFIAVRGVSASAAYPLETTITSTVPFTWASGDTITVSGTIFANADT